MKKKIDPRSTDTRVTAGSGNVFTELGFDKADAQVMAWRGKLMLRLRGRLAKDGLTQAEAAKQLHMTEPLVSTLSRARRRISAWTYC